MEQENETLHLRHFGMFSSRPPGSFIDGSSVGEAWNPSYICQTVSFLVKQLAGAEGSKRMLSDPLDRVVPDPFVDSITTMKTTSKLGKILKVLGGIGYTWKR